MSYSYGLVDFISRFAKANGGKRVAISESVTQYETNLCKGLTKLHRWNSDLHTNKLTKK
jgi:hypothetical protein